MDFTASISVTSGGCFQKLQCISLIFSLKRHEPKGKKERVQVRRVKGPREKKKKKASSAIRFC